MDERRKAVAERLRYIASDGTDNPMGSLKYALGLPVTATYRDVLRELAGLIDGLGK